VTVQHKLTLHDNRFLVGHCDTDFSPSGATVTNESDSYKGVKRMLFFANAFYYSGQNFCLLCQL